MTTPRGVNLVLAGELDKHKRDLLARAYDTVPVPAELERPLVCGNPEQIAALRRYEAALASENEVTDVPGRYEVEVRGIATRTVIVEACDAEEAECKADDGEIVEGGAWDIEEDWGAATVIRRLDG